MLFSGVPYAEATRWHITQLTDNNYEDLNPQIDGSNVVWQGNNGVFLYDGDIVSQLTDTSYEVWNPQVSGSNVVWGGSLGGFQVFLHDGVTTTQLTTGSGSVGPQISGSTVVWFSSQGSTDYEIYLYDGGAATQLTDNEFADWYPQIDGCECGLEGRAIQATKMTAKSICTTERAFVA